MSVTEKWIGFSEMEFKILLSAYHIDSLICFEKEDCSFSQEDYNRGIASMFQRNLLRTSKNSENLLPADEIKNLMEGIQNATAVFLLRDNTGRMPTHIVYAGKKNAVIATPGARKEEYIRMFLLPKKKLMEWLDEAEILPPDFVPADLRGENVWRDTNESNDSEFDAFFYEKDTPEEPLRWQIVPEHIGYELIRNNNGRWQSTTYGKETLFQAMLCYIEEGKDGFS